MKKQLFVNCGCDSESKEDDSFYTHYLSGNCGLDVITDYNCVVLNCIYIRIRDEIEECKSKLIKFNRIDCSAKKGFGMDKKVFTITESYIVDLIQKVENL